VQDICICLPIIIRLGMTIRLRMTTVGARVN
jgi:hypothetical protein